MERGAKWRPAVVAFADLMEARLAEHDDRRGGETWGRVADPMELVEGARRNAEELAHKVDAWQAPGLWQDKPDNLAIMRQAADVANFAMMIGDRCGPLERRPLDPWLPIDAGAKTGKLVWLLVDYREGEHPLEDATFAATLGYNSLADTGEDEWKLVGWCWSHDHFVDGKGKVLAWKPIGFELLPPACFVPTSDGANPPATAIDAALASKAPE